VKKKLILPIIVLMTALSLFALTGCGNATPATIQAQDTLTNDNTTNASIPPQQGGTHQISSQSAREIAVDFVGYGAVHDVLAFTDEGVLTFEVDVRHNAMRYVVLVNAENGNVTRLSRYEDETALIDVALDSPVMAEETTPNFNVVPDYPPHQPTATPQSTASPSVSGQGSRPSNPEISLERAIEIAYADLASRGINATFSRDSGMDWERGQWVWELLFRTHGERMPLIEFYINVDNGNIVKFEWDD